MQKTVKKHLYYTKDHEWIDFRGTIAYIGISRFKLTGFREVQQIIFNQPSGFKKRGELIATLKYSDYQVDVKMPVDGKLLEVNATLIYDTPEFLLQHAENSGWIALIVPAQPYERKDLLPSAQYQMNGKNKYAKWGH